MSIFYDSFVDLQPIFQALDRHPLTADERQELLDQFDSTLHYEMFTVILARLPEHTHEHFLVNLRAAPHSGEHIRFIQQYHPDIEAELAEVGKRSTERFLDAIHSSMV